MKTNRRNPLFSSLFRNNILTTAATSAIAIIFAQTLDAASGTWKANNSGTWGTPGNWVGDIIADGSGSTASFVFNITANRTVTLDSNRTLTTLTFTDATTASHDWIVNNSNGAVLTLAGTAPGFNVTNRTATISAPIAGTVALTKTGAGALVLSGANTFDAGLTTVNGVLQLNNNAAGGTGPIAVSTTTGAAANRLVINGGVTISNPVSVSAHIGTAGFGSLQQTGTGQARLTGPITITGGPSAGGNFVGGTAVGNELVLAGPINSTVAQLSLRDGRVVFGGGGSGGSWNSLLVTNTALVGATDGIPTGVTVKLGASASGTLDLNGFDQSLAGLELGNGGNAFTGTVNLGAKTLALTGNVTSVSATGQNVTHRINATAGGGLDLGASNRTLTLPDTVAVDDLVITGAAIKGSGGLTKEGNGSLLLQNVTSQSPLTVNAGTLVLQNVTTEAALTANAGTLATSGISDGNASTIATPALVFGSNPTALRMKLGPASDLITAGSLTTSGTTTVIINQSGGLLANGIYPLIAYSGTSPGLSGFVLDPIGHATASLIDTAGAISVQVTGNESIVWDGTLSNDWVGANGNWKRSSNSAATDYINGDVVIFNDMPLSSTVVLGSNVTPGSVTFNNSAATAYSLSGAGGITGTSGLTKNNDGTLTISTPNSYTGATAITGGTLELNTSGGSITASSGVSIASGATFKITRDGTATATNTTFSRALSGAGKLDVNMRDTAGTTAADSLLLTGANSGFSGPIRLLAPAEGTYRLSITAPSQLGTGTIEVQSGAQLYVTGATNIYPNNITIAGIGFTDASANMGALRVDGTTWAGDVTVDAGGSRIASHNSTGTISGKITGGDVEFQVSNYNNSYTTILTGANTYGATTIGGGNTQTAGPPSMRVNIGAGGTTGTLGSGSVTINGDGANGVLGFDRSDGYTLLTGQTITSGGTNLSRTFIDIDCTGTGFSDNGNIISLGTAAPASGGNFRIGQSRANAIANISGSLTAQTVRVATGQNNGTLNLASTAVIDSNTLYAGESANNFGTINHPAGAKVTVTGQVRVGHFGTNTSTYNLSGGTLTLTGDSPNNSPSTAIDGTTTTVGDNNLNLTNPTTIVGGGVYLGNDGTGIFNHTGGTLTTNWIVLDNRGDTAGGANMPDGIDRYNLSGTSMLKLRSTYGLIARNLTTDVRFGGGTVQVDNTGTGFGTGADLNIPLDAAISTVASTTTTLDTNGATNAFTLTRDVNGSGTLALTGGGAINLSTAGYQTINAALSGANPINKTGLGITTLAGPMGGLTGIVKVSEGLLNVPASLNTTVTVEPNGSLGGEISLPTLNLNGGTIVFDPTTGGSLAVNTLNLNANSLLDVSAAPGVGTFTALTYTNKTGISTLAVRNGSNFRNAPSVNEAGNAFTVTFNAGKALTWNGAASGVWDINAAVNWADGANPETFFSGDSVTFPEGGANPAVTLTGLIAPAGVSVTSDTTNYTFTSTTDNLLTGTTGLAKSGTSTLTLVGANSYGGSTTVSGGVLAISDAASLGSAAPGNGIVLSGGGTLNTGAANIDLGLNRSIAVGTGGGILAHNNATANTTITIAIPGAISGSEALTFQSNAANNGTFSLTGNNAAYTGAISINAVSTGVTNLRIASNDSVPNASSITVNYPAASTTSGANNSLTLQDGVTLPAATTVNLMSGLPNTALSLRSQIATSGAVTINGPIKLAGDTIVQVNTFTGSTATLNGNISEASPGSFAESPLQTFTNVLFLRGTGTIIANGLINLPSTGSTVAVTDGATAVLSTAGHNFMSANALFGTLRIGATNAIPTTARLVVGQGGNQACTLDLNGFDQTVTGLEWQAPTGNLLTKGISNSHPTNVSTFTVNQAAAPAASFNGTISGNTNLVKEGAETTTLLAGASNFTGNVTVNNGTLAVDGLGANAGENGGLGAANVPGKTITVNASSILSLTRNNIFGNGIGNANLPAVLINGGTLTSTRYNALGNVALNGGTLTQAATDGPGAFEGYQFLGSVTVGGSAASTIAATTGRANHLGTNTQFIVADAVGGADLTVSAGLKNPSNDIGGIGGLTKTGPGTMVLAGINTHTGDTVVNGGTLQLADDAQLRFAIGAASGANNSLSGSGTVTIEGDFAIDTTAAAALSAGTWMLENVSSLTGAYGTNFRVVNTDGSPWSNAGDTWTRDGGAGKTWSFDETTGTLTLSQSAGYAAWAAINAGGQDPSLDFDLDRVQNGVEFFMGETGSTFTANPTVVTAGAVRTVTWPKSASFNGTYKVETSETMMSWTNVTGSAVDNGSSVVYTLPAGSPKIFVRLVVTPN